ncbi:DUF423 domain-containing protein [Flavobacterium sp.]|uniref:DUF423 domain-containing protein n=1 Tax=Flavobacterium sp. TaxID=239 RepID=UPI003528AF14
MEKKITIVAALLGCIAIILGAFGAHKLKEMLLPEQLTSFEVGVRYQMYHALFLLLIVNNTLLNIKEKTIIFYLTLVGVLFFSGSIYILSTASITGVKTKFLGPITPVGGLFLISSWLFLLYAVIVKKSI